MSRLFRHLAALLLLFPLVPAASRSAPVPANLVQNAAFTATTPTAYTLTGDVEYRYLGDPHREVAPYGVALQSDKTANATHAGCVSQTVAGMDPKSGRWYRFTFRGLPQENFILDGDALVMKVEFFAGTSVYDGKAKHLYSLIQQERKDLAVNGDHRVNGAAVWHTYELDVYLPTPQIDSVRLSVSFDHPAPRLAHAEDSNFFVTDFSLTRIDAPAPPPAEPATRPAIARPDNLIPIGGRWFYKANPGETTVPKLFTADNADRLIYHDDQWSAPFAGQMSSWLRAGDLDLAGNVVEKDRPVPDAVTVGFDATSMIIHSKNLPNHPTGKFPEEGFGNPNYIQEKRNTFYIPLNPKENPGHIATAIDNSNHALPMGPIGVAANGVVFFNPFDAGSQDASNIMDYCCGHPSPDNTYHYHKYPICINSPWADEGNAHSPLIGWAFDGFPIYGPYVKANLLAKDAKGEEGLNDFNLHTDKDRGPHYQVTPGKFPYIIGGYWGTADPRDTQRGPGGGMGGPGAGPGRGPGRGPPNGGLGPPPQ